MLISIIIVSYNVRHYLRQCLDSAFRSAEAAGIEVEVFVVDNASEDGSVEYLRKSFPQYAPGCSVQASLHFIANHENVGFGRANNQALQQCKGKYVLFLNPDTILTESTFKDCLETATMHPNLGAIGVKMLHANGRFAPESRRGLPTPWVAFCKMIGLTRLFPKSRRFAHYYMSYLSQDEVNAIDIVSGAFMFCNREALLVTGGFDEAFFMYGEDIDLSYRLLKAGYSNYYVPTPIVHYKGESTHKNSFHYVHVFYKAMLIFFKKHFPSSSLALRIPVHCAVYGRALLALLQQWGTRLKQVFKAKQAPTFLLDPRTSVETTEHLKTAAKNWPLQFVHPQQLSRKDAYVVYSPEECSYERMISELETAQPQRSIATYFPKWHVLITPRAILQ